MQWDSFSDFLAMGGYAPYVWASVGLCGLAMLVEPWLIGRQRQQVMKALRRQRRQPPTVARAGRATASIRRRVA